MWANLLRGKLPSGYGLQDFITAYLDVDVFSHVLTNQPTDPANTRTGAGHETGIGQSPLLRQSKNIKRVVTHRLESGLTKETGG